MINNKGISLIEILLSIGLLVCVCVPLLSVFGGYVIDNRLSKDFDDDRLMAEKYMEKVKTMDVSDLESEFEYIDTNAHSVQELVDIGIYEASDTDDILYFRDTSGDSVWIKMKPVYGYGSGDSDIEENDGAWKRETMLSGENELDITINDNYFPPPYSTNILLQFRETLGQQTVIVTNELTEKVVFYCQYVGEKKDYKLPKFVIKEGKVAFFDYSIPYGNSKLKEASAAMSVENDRQMDISYNVTIKVRSGKGKSDYTLYGLKSIN